VAQNIRRAIFVEHRMPSVRGIGAGAVAQACKGIAIARGDVATQGYDLFAAIGFEMVIGEGGKEVTAQIFRLSLR
jgi:stage V sporulation protein SpoVS